MEEAPYVVPPCTAPPLPARPEATSGAGLQTTRVVPSISARYGSPGGAGAHAEAPAAIRNSSRACARAIGGRAHVLHAHFFFETVGGGGRQGGARPGARGAPMPLHTLFSLFFLCHLLPFTSPQPSDWRADILGNDALYGGDETGSPDFVAPATGNGYLGWQVGAELMYVAGV